MQRYILAIDQGTTGSTALLFDESLAIRGAATVEFPQHFPKPSWVEHDLQEIWASVGEAVTGVFKKSSVSPDNIAAIGITNQRETTCLWHRNETGTPFGKAIVWQDRRTGPECAILRKANLEASVHRRTGLRLDPYFSATKLQWMLKNYSGARVAAQKGKILFGTVDSYLIYRLSGRHVTDPSNASRTLLMNLQKVAWDEDMLKLFRVPKTILPEILPSATEYGRTRNVPFLPNGIPITGVAGDQQAALFGQACFAKGTAKCTYGTGAFVLMNTGKEPVFSKHRLLTSVAWKLGKEATYCLEGSSFIAGAVVQWLRDGLKLIPNAAAIEDLAASVPDSDGVTFVPALSGMGAPYWLSEATGLMTGLTRRTTQAHVARATLDGIAFQVSELLEAMKKDVGKRFRSLQVDGGASSNSLLMQIQADLLGTEIVRSKIMETTALGAGLQAGLAVGLFRDLKEIEQKWQASGRFQPRLPQAQRHKEMERWRKAMRALSLLAKH